MARYTGPRCRLCRTEQKKLFLKGDRCKSDKCPVNRKRPAPGKNPKARTGKMSNYGIQLREKQKLKRSYGLQEAQFRLFFERALAMPGVTGDSLFSLLERRLETDFHFTMSKSVSVLMRLLQPRSVVRRLRSPTRWPNMGVGLGDRVASFIENPIEPPAPPPRATDVGRTFR